MLSPEAKKQLEKQQYRIIGSHSAVKVCGWTKNMIRGLGGCYKLKFYGIMSNQCMQMTTSISCANRCKFCWRDYKAPVSKEWKWEVDDPDFILHNALHSHHNLLVGFKGSEKANLGAYNKSREVRHVALSLTGEPITYPRMNELIDGFHKQDISTFLVTRAQYPEEIRNLRPVTQLYISLNAPTKEIMKEIDVPLFPDYWERSMKGLQYMKEKKQRTTLRLTLVKGINDIMHDKYAELINISSPDFIEVKAYMFVGASRERLEEKNMPSHKEVIEFTKSLLKFLPDYDIVTDHVESRVVMLAEKKFLINGKWHTWIDFPKFHELYHNFLETGKEFTSMDYLKITPRVGITENPMQQEQYVELKL